MASNPQRYALGAIAILLSVLSGPAAQAQADLMQNDDAAAGMPHIQPGGSALPAETLGADDLIELAVPHCAELSRTFRVGSDGTLSLPLFSSKVTAAGLKPDELATQIQTLLMKQHLLVDPLVSVAVLEYRSRPVVVMGAVAHPLTFQATGRTTLLDALARAGGVGTLAGGNLILTDRNNGVDRVQVIPLAELMNANDSKYNAILHGGEEIRVPEASKVFVTGNVRHPGMYPMQGDSETTVLKAIALSQGLDSFSAHTAFIYRRRATGTDRQELSVPLNRIMARKADDVLLKPDDILYIPDATGRRLTTRVISQITGFGQSAGTAVLTYH
jgi:polysaccharide export outer membrane protein